jgi:uncharacterized protein
MSLKSYTLITSALGGIGYELAKLAAAEGENLLLVARSANKLDKLAEDIKKNNKSEVIVIALDLSAKQVLIS